jgi:cytochrome b561
MTSRYTGTAIALHWVMAILLIGLMVLGVYMQDLALSPTKLRLYSWHKWAGVTALVLLLVRLVWRITHHPPALPSAMPSWQALIARTTHFLLYLLMLAIPVSGWLMSSAKGFQTVYFGVLPLPDLLDKNAVLGDALQGLHMVLNFTFAALLVVHAGAALKHHFLDRSDILTRMLPGQRTHRT